MGLKYWDDASGYRERSALKSDQNGIEIGITASYFTAFSITLKSDQNGIEILEEFLKSLPDPIS